MLRPFGRYWTLWDTYLRPRKGRVGLLALLLALSIALQLANPQVVRAFLDTTERGGPERVLLLAGTLFVVIALLQRGAALATTYLSVDLGWAATNVLRGDITRHALQLDMGFHKRHTPGELIERIDGDVTALAQFFSQLVVQVVGNGLLVGGIILLLLVEDWRLGVGLAIYTLLAGFLLLRVQNVAVQRWAASRAASADHFGFLEERLGGTEDIRANGFEPYVLRRLYALMRDLLRAERSARLVSNITYVLTNFSYAIGYALGLGLGGYLYLQGEVTIGGAYLIVFYIGMLSAPLDALRAQVQDLQQATASIGRVDELLREAPEVRDTGRVTLPDGALGVVFDDVTFGYEATPVLQGVGFELRPGAVLGVLGRTGSGKTTLTRLLLRLYDPQSGAIRLGGVDLREAGLAELRARVGMVTQDVQLFQGTVRDNLAFFDDRIDDASILAALDQLGLGEWLRGLPDGLDTPLASGGQGLSAGEAQLLAFARVFLKDPGLVILDEASSRLDPATERLLEHAVDRLVRGAGRTGIVVAHRLQTVLRADEILILEDGRIVEHGPREALMADPTSRFAGLLRTGLEEVLA